MKRSVLIIAGSFVLLLACKKDNDNSNNNFINQQDENFITQISYFNHNEITVGNLAARQGNNNAVKEYGANIAADLSVMQTSFDSLASIMAINVPSTTDPAHLASTTFLQTLTGNTFDTTYINAQVIDTDNAIKQYNKEVSDGNNIAVKALAQKTASTQLGYAEEAAAIQAVLK